MCLKQASAWLALGLIGCSLAVHSSANALCIYMDFERFVTSVTQTSFQDTIHTCTITFCAREAHQEESATKANTNQYELNKHVIATAKWYRAIQVGVL